MITKTTRTFYGHDVDVTYSFIEKYSSELHLRKGNTQNV